MAVAHLESLEIENSGQPEKRLLWSDNETDFFLKLLGQYQITRHLEHRKYLNAGMFQSLEGPMRAAGFNRTFNQLRIKWKNMKKSFVDARRLEASGTPPYSVCPYYDQLHAILKNVPWNCQVGSSGEDSPSSFDNICDIAANAAPDCHDDLVENQEETAMDIFNGYPERAGGMTIKKEHSASIEHLSPEPSHRAIFQKLDGYKNTDPDKLFLAMILPDMKKLSAPKKRKVKMEIQKLLDDALTEEDQ